VNYPELYVDFLDAWSSVTGVAPDSLRMPMLEGSYFVKAVQGSGVDILLSVLRSSDPSTLQSPRIFLDDYCRTLVRSPPVPAPATKAEAGLYGNSMVSDPKLDAAWKELLGFWVRNRERPEQEDVMLSAFRSAVADHGVETVMRAARYYCERVLAGAAGLPYHLATFLGRDAVFKQWSAAAAIAPTPAEDAAFDLAYRVYPDFPSKDLARSESRSYYLQFVAAEDAADFLMAAIAYRAERAGEVESVTDEEDADFFTVAPATDASRFTVRFRKFVASWRHQRRHHDVADAASRLLVAGLRRAGVPEQRWWTEVSGGAGTGMDGVATYWASEPPGTLASTASAVLKAVFSELDPGTVDSVLAYAKEHAYEVASAAASFVLG